MYCHGVPGADSSVEFSEGNVPGLEPGEGIGDDVAGLGEVTDGVVAVDGIGALAMTEVAVVGGWPDKPLAYTVTATVTVAVGIV